MSHSVISYKYTNNPIIKISNQLSHKANSISIVHKIKSKSKGRKAYISYQTSVSPSSAG